MNNDNDDEDRRTPDEELIRRAEAEWEGEPLGGIFERPRPTHMEQNVVQLSKLEYHDLYETPALSAEDEPDDEGDEYDEDDEDDDKPGAVDVALALALRVTLVVFGVVLLVMVIDWLSR